MHTYGKVRTSCYILLFLNEKFKISTEHAHVVKSAYQCSGGIFFFYLYFYLVDRICLVH